MTPAGVLYYIPFWKMKRFEYTGGELPVRGAAGRAAAGPESVFLTLKRL